MTTLNISEHTAYPPLFINKYILEQLKKFHRTKNGVDVPLYIELPGRMEPIIPVQSTSIDDLYDEIAVDEGTFLIAYDRLVRYNQDTTYWNKREQLVYTIHSNKDTLGLDVSRVIIEALDREDAAAQDVNSWIANNPDKVPSINIFFHNFRVFQIDETRDIVELGSVKFNWRGKIIIEYDYHANTPSLYD